MKLPIVYPLTSPRSHRTSRITAIVKSIVSPSCLPVGHKVCRALTDSFPVRSGAAELGVCHALPPVGARRMSFCGRVHPAVVLCRPMRKPGVVLVRVLLCIAAVSLAAPASIFAQAPAPDGGGIDPALLTGLRWRSIGPARGGRSQAVAGSASRPLEYYF